VAAAGRQVAAHAGLTFFGLMAGNVLSYVFYALVSRALGVEAYGAFSAVVAFVMILQVPAMIVQMVVAKLASDFTVMPERLVGLVRAVDRTAFLVSLVAAALLAIFAVPLAALLNLNDTLLVVLAACSLGGAIMLLFFRGVLQGTSAFGAFAISNVAENLGKAVCAPVLGLIGGLRGALAGMAIGYGLAAYYTYAAGRPHRHGTHERFSLRSVASMSGYVALAVIGINVLLLYDVVLAKRFLDPHAAGLYGAAALAGRALYAVISFVPTVLLPKVALLAARRERTRFLFVQGFGITVAICVAACSFYALLPQLVVTVVAGRAFGEAASFVVPYVVAIAALGLANLVATYNIARGRLEFVIPLASIAVGEIVVVSVRHRSVGDLLQTIVLGHSLALVATAISLFWPSRDGALGGTLQPNDPAVRVAE
jgi:O-antigen/teichoic acid export membrane protein